jgi:signal peptidase II
MRELVAMAVVFFLLDRATKSLIERRAVNDDLTFVHYLRLCRSVHAKAAYTKLSNRLLLLLQWLLAWFCVVALHRAGNHFQSHLALWGLGAALGGSAGNLWDILFSRGIIDFIDFGWWPAFNLADVAILAGLAAAFFG